MNFHPSFKRVLVEKMDVRVTKGGIAIPDIAKVETNKGRVISIGADVQSTRIGDIVEIKQYAGQRIKIGKKNFMVLEEENILGLYDEDTNEA